MSNGQKRRTKRRAKRGRKQEIKVLPKGNLGEEGGVKIWRIDLSPLLAFCQPDMWPGKAIQHGGGSVASSGFETNRRRH